MRVLNLVLFAVSPSRKRDYTNLLIRPHPALSSSLQSVVHEQILSSIWNV